MPDTVMLFFFPILLLHFPGFGTSAQTVTDGVIERKVEGGRLRGKRLEVEGKGVQAYLSVPYGEPPLGKLRFQPPHKAKSWDGVRLADKLAPACFQEKDATPFWGAEMWNAQGNMSEDCLYLNIWTPSTGRDLPVMVWLFGGGFWYGSASLSLYDGLGMAAEGQAVVVNVNYRVGPLGFLFLNHSNAPGNMGMMDQQLAFQWIQDNIHNFGGDPNKVTLFGESAGAASVVAHMVAPGSRSLFNRGILQSGSLDNRWAMDGVHKAYTKGVNFLKELNCDAGINMKKNIACLREVDAKKLGENQWVVPSPYLEFAFVMVSSDEFFFKGKDAFRALRERDYQAKDLIIGLNQDEGMFWNAYYMSDFNKSNPSMPNITWEGYLANIEQAFGALPVVARRGAAYQYSGTCTGVGGSYAEPVNQMVGDYFFTCDSLWLADQLVEGGESSVYIYHFTQRSSTNPWPQWMGVMHGYEIEFVFGIPIVNKTMPDHSTGLKYSPREIELSRRMIQYWVSFGKTGQPKLWDGKDKRGEWKRYIGNNENWFELGTKPGTRQVDKSEECKMWRSVKDMEYWQHLAINVGPSLSFNTFLFVAALIIPLSKS